MVFYRKYRPQTLAELDNIDVRKQLSRFLSQESIPHAFLFSGPKGTGKTSAARILAKSINCTRKKNDACGKCDICTSIATGDNLDILEIDAASNRSIDEIRTLKEGIKLAPLMLPYKVYIIDEVHMLTTEAFNALLKTLEEPPKHAVFILATTEPEKLPGTIVSRCIHVQFAKASRDEICASLSRIAKGESLDVGTEALQQIAIESDGSFRDAAKLLEQVALSGKTIDVTAIDAMVGRSQKSVQTQFVESLRTKNAKKAFEIVQQVVSEEKNIRLFVKGILEVLEELLITHITAKEKTTDKDVWELAELKKALITLSTNWSEYKASLIPELPLELAIVEYCEDSKDAGIYRPPKKPTIAPLQNTVSKTMATVDPSAAPVAERWNDILEALKQHNHSIVGVLRSCRPLSIGEGVLLIESPYKFHSERLNEKKTQGLLAEAVASVVGLEVQVKAVLKNSK